MRTLGPSWKCSLFIYCSTDHLIKPLHELNQNPLVISHSCTYMFLIQRYFRQRTLTYFVRGNISVWLTSCLTGLDSAVLLNWNYKQICLFGQILTGQTGGQTYSDISPYKVSEWVFSALGSHRCREVSLYGWSSVLQVWIKLFYY